MTNLKMTLFDGTEIPLDAFGLPCMAVTTCQNEDDLLAQWKKLTPMALSTVNVVQGEQTVFAFAGVKLEGTQTLHNPDGTLTVHFFFSGVMQELTNQTDAEYITAAKILMGEVE